LDLAGLVFAIDLTRIITNHISATSRKEANFAPYKRLGHELLFLLIMHCINGRLTTTREKEPCRHFFVFRVGFGFYVKFWWFKACNDFPGRKNAASGSPMSFRILE
jgi:hypothetical protein